MDAQQRVSLSELKVGIFVLVACFILAMAIFTIGKVDLFEEQFWARTYLSNISGLKSGDVVLLGGVEVGNVASVEITPPGEELPDTQLNLRIQDRIEKLTSRLAGLEEAAASANQELIEAQESYEQAVSQHGVNSEQARSASELMTRLESNLQERRDALQSLNDDIARQNSRLQNIEVKMRISTRYRDWVRADSSISLGSIGLLGDKYIEISLGRSPEPPQTTPMEVDTWIFGTTTTEAVLITGTQQASFAELITGANDILANFETLSAQIGDIMSGFESGQGTVGKFFTDPSFYNSLNMTVERASQAADHLALVLEDVRSGSGTITKLLQEDELYVRITSSVQKLEGLLEQVEKGEGTLGKLMNDPSVFERSDKFLANLNAITDRIESGEGTLGKLATDDQLYRSLEESTGELASILKDIQEGKGTLGRLAQDEQLYTNLNQLSSELVKFIYDFRQNPKKFLTIKFEVF
jgi:phospholipid/cholesterol/gamma-HCH transport system substrate-binding protein